MDRLSRIRSEGGFFRITPRATLRFSGKDALRYLNGQVSNDLRKLKAATAMQACVLTAKGRLCAVVRIWRDADAFILDSDLEVRGELSSRLERYIVADDVELADISEGPARWHIFGPAAEKYSGIAISRLGFPGKDIAELPDALEISPEEHEFLRIENGIPKWGAELTEFTLPHEALLERDAVDLAKGCYVGQEIVSRLQSVGKVNRILSGLQGSFPPVPATLQNSEGRSVGIITSAITGENVTIALGYIPSRGDLGRFLVIDESGACIGEAETREFPPV